MPNAKLDQFDTHLIRTIFGDVIDVGDVGVLDTPVICPCCQIYEVAYGVTCMLCSIIDCESSGKCEVEIIPEPKDNIDCIKCGGQCTLNHKPKDNFHWF